MESWKFFFGNTKFDNAIGKGLILVAIFVLLIVVSIQEASFTPEGAVTSTHRYGTPLPEEGRTVWNFDYETKEYFYKDQRGQKESHSTSSEARYQPREYRGETLEERRYIRQLRELYRDQGRRREREEIEEELEMERDFGDY